MPRTRLGAFVEALLDAWRAAGVEALVLRNSAGLPDDPGNDLDVLARPATRPAAERILGDVAADHGLRIHHRVEFSPVSLFVSGRGVRLHVDLFDRIEWRGCRILSVDDVMRRRTVRRGFAVPDPLDAAVVNLLTRLLYVGRVRDKYREPIARIAEADPGSLTARLTPIVGSRLASSTVRRVAVREWTAIEASTPALRRAVLFRALGRPGDTMRAWMSDARRFFGRLRRPPGLLIAVLGPDGSGKTSLADGILHRLGHTFYPGLGLRLHWRPGVLPYRRSEAERHPVEPHAPRPRGVLASATFLAWHAADFGLGGVLRILPTRFRNGLVVADRYYHDVYCDPLRYRLRAPRALIGAFRLWVPEPDVLVILRADPAVLYARKREVAVDELTAQLERYDRLAEGFPRVLVLDSTGPPSRTLDRVEAFVIEVLEARLSA